jgi:alkylation response protein AidB-like acyl-CoA dehydrogenase
MSLRLEHAVYRADVRRFMESIVRPISDAYDFDTSLTRDQLADVRVLLQSHAIGAEQPVQERGAPDLIATGIFTEELARIDCSLAGLIPSLFFTNLPVIDVLTAGQVARYGHLFEPGRIVAVGLSEPGVGSDPSGIQTTAHRADGGWVINGQKLWTTNGTVSSGIIVACRLPEFGGAISAFVVDRTDYAYRVEPIECLGMRRVSTCVTYFENCRVPAIAQVGETGQGLGKLLRVVDRSRLNLSFTSVGIAQACLDIAVRYATERQQFGRVIGGFQLVQELIADMATDVLTGRLLALHAASAVESGRRARLEVALAKAHCTEMAVRVASSAIAVHGAMGLTRECSAERLLRDARMQTIPDGTTQIQKLMAAREILGISAIG